MTTSNAPHPSEIEANALIQDLPNFVCPTLAQALAVPQLATALRAPATHKPHPVAEIVRAITLPGKAHTTRVLANTESAIRACANDKSGTASAWARTHLLDACIEPAFENAAAKLGELRAFGALWGAGFNATIVPTAKVPTHDFDVAIGTVTFGVEVHSKQMNTQQASLLAKPQGGTMFIYPAGQPRKDETTAENVTSKFAQIKPRAKQAAETTPTILWLDLQDSDWWAVDSSHAEAVVVSRAKFFSGGLWHAIYGAKGTPLFEYHNTENGGFEGVPLMAHPGLLEQCPAWAGVVLSLPKATIFFENPQPPCALDDSVRQALVRLPWFTLSKSRMNWPDATLVDHLSSDRALLSSLLTKAKYQW